MQRNLSAVVMRVALSHCPFSSKLLHTAVEKEMKEAEFIYRKE